MMRGLQEKGIRNMFSGEMSMDNLAGTQPIWERSLQWHLRTLFVVATTAVWVLFLRLGLMQFAYSAGGILFPTAGAFVILGAGLCGYQYGLILFLMIFFGEYAIAGYDTILEMFPLALFLVLSLLAGLLAQNRWFCTIRHTLAVFALLEVTLSVVFYLVFVVLLQGGDLNVMETTIGTIPETALAVAVLYLYFRYAPDRLKQAFGVGFFYTEDFDIDVARRTYNRYGRLAWQISVLSVMEGVVFSVMAVLFSHIKVGLYETAVLREDWQGYDIRMMVFLLALTVAFPVVLTANEAVLGMVSRVIRAQQKLETDLAVSEARSDAKSTFLSSCPMRSVRRSTRCWV